MEQGDYVSALYLSKYFAEKGEARAQYNLGVIFAGGLGVEPDYRLAKEWYRKAVENGDTMAVGELENLEDRERPLDQMLLSARSFSISSKAPVVSCPSNYSAENVNKLFWKKVKFRVGYADRLSVLNSAGVQPAWIKHLFSSGGKCIKSADGRVYAFTESFEQHNAGRVVAILVDVSRDYVGVYTTDIMQGPDEKENIVLSSGDAGLNEKVLADIGYLEQLNAM